jgi:ribosomal protein L16 Arg81 hydroxylase
MWSTDSEDRSTFAWLLAPYTIEEFRRDFYERAPLYIDRGYREDHFVRYFSLNELDRIIYGSELRTKDLRAVKEGALQRVDSYTRTKKKKKAEEKDPPSDIIDPDKLSALFAEGCTLVLDAMDQYSITLSTLCRRLEAFFRHRLNINVYLTPAGSQGFAPHYDSHDTLILQVRGTKRWRIYGSAFELPLDDQTFDKKTHRVGDVQREIDMKPGDVLYIPRGFVHEGVTNEQLSLHLTLGLHPPRWTHVLHEAVNAIADREAAWRVSAPENWTDEQIQALLQKLTHEEIRTASNRIGQRFVTERANMLDGQLQQLEALGSLSAGSTIARRHHVLYDLSADERSTKLSFSNKTLVFGPKAAALVGELTARSSAPMSALLQHDDNALSIVRKLIKEGFALQVLSAQELVDENIVA